MTDALSLIRIRFHDNFSSLPIAWTNSEFDPADPNGDGTDTPFKRNGPFVQFDETGVFPAAQISIGASQNRERVFGEVKFHIFTPKGTGVSLANTVATEIKDLFRWRSEEGMTTRSPFIESDPEPEGQYFRTTVVLPFKEDNLHAFQ